MCTHHEITVNKACSQNSMSTPHSWWSRGVCTCTLRPASLLLLSCCKGWSLGCHIITHHVMTSHLGFPWAPQNILLKMIILHHMMVILSIQILAFMLCFDLTQHSCTIDNKNCVLVSIVWFPGDHPTLLSWWYDLLVQSTPMTKIRHSFFVMVMPKVV